MKITSNSPTSTDIIIANKRLEEKRKELEARKANTLAAKNPLALLPNHLAILIDCSGSMAISFGTEHESRIKAANTGLQAIVSASDPKKTAYSIIEINSRSRLSIPPTNDYLKIQAKTFDAEGGTDGYGALRIAKSLSPLPSRIIILTDGEWYPNEDYVLRLAAEHPIIPIDTIAIGEGNDKFLMELANISGGIFKRATNSADLKQHFIMLEPRNYLQLTHG